MNTRNKELKYSQGDRVGIQEKCAYCLSLLKDVEAHLTESKKLIVILKCESCNRFWRKEQWFDMNEEKIFVDVEEITGRYKNGKEQ